MIYELLSNKIQILDEAKDWKDAITKSAAPLLRDGNIEQEYVEAMIQMCEQYDAYIVIADNFALPHATSKNGVNKMGVSLTVVKKPVDFIGKPVQVMLTLAAGNDNDHIELLKEVAELMGDPSLIEQLINASSVEEIDNIIKENSLKI